MAKRGGQQQLQTDLQSDTDFDRFIDRPGLLVIDVYSDWCGPCLSMVGILKKIKLEIGGDNLSLAIAKSDNITALKRFCKKSEPIWLFIVNGRAVNIYFGVQTPRLMKLITTELDQLNGKSSKTTYGITELQPEEVKRKKKKDDAIAAKELAEYNEKEKKRRDYLTFVTDTILENMPEMGVSIFGPQVNRDMFKKIMEPADLLKVQCKDRKVAIVTQDNFDVINFACNNPLEEDVIEYLCGKECLLCFWRIEDSKKVVETMFKLAGDLSSPRTMPPDDYDPEERVLPALIEPLTVKIEIELASDEEWDEEDSDEERERLRLEEEKLEEIEEEDEGEEGFDNEQPDAFGYDFPLGSMMDPLLEDMEEKVEVDLPPPKRYKKKKVVIPPVWVPGNARTHAAMIYVFFRHQTTPFLGPDPKPEPPCVVMAFDPYKKRDLIEVAERHKDDIPLYGFFTSDDAEQARFITRFPEVYSKTPQNIEDKLVFKVNKNTSNTMLSLATYGPTYVSPNITVGKTEATKFFPETYEEDELSPEQQSILEAKRKHSKDITKKRRTKELQEAPQAREEGEADDGEAAEGAEGAEGEGELDGEGEGDLPEYDEGEGFDAEEMDEEGMDGYLEEMAGEQLAEPTPEPHAEAPAEASGEAPQNPAEAPQSPPEAPAEATQSPPEAPQSPPEGGAPPPTEGGQTEPAAE